MEKLYGRDTKAHLDMLMSESIAAGLGRPYVALMNTDANMLRKYCADALGAYANWSGRDTTYAALADSDRKRWDAFRQTGAKVVPLVSLGWNQMPRTDNPPPWGGCPYFERPTPDEGAAHIRESLAYVERYPDVCDARSILCYAWNEYAEGGWLCPAHADGTKYLDATRMMIENIESTFLERSGSARECLHRITKLEPRRVVICQCLKTRAHSCRTHLDGFQGHALHGLRRAAQVSRTPRCSPPARPR